MKFFKTIISSFLFVFCLIINQVNAEELRIGTASQGGAFYPVGQAISTLVNKHAKGLEMVPVVTGGSVQNPKLVNKKEVDIAITNNNIAVLANKGAARYKKTGKMNSYCLTTHFPPISKSLESLHAIAESLHTNV